MFHVFSQFLPSTNQHDHNSTYLSSSASVSSSSSSPKRRSSTKSVNGTMKRRHSPPPLDRVSDRGDAENAKKPAPGFFRSTAHRVMKFSTPSYRTISSSTSSASLTSGKYNPKNKSSYEYSKRQEEVFAIDRIKAALFVLKLVTIYVLWRCLMNNLFGFRSVKGGLIGPLVDFIGNKYVKYRFDMEFPHGKDRLNVVSHSGFRNFENSEDDSPYTLLNQLSSQTGCISSNRAAAMKMIENHYIEQKDHRSSPPPDTEITTGVPPFVFGIYKDAWTAANLGLSSFHILKEERLHPVVLHHGKKEHRTILFTAVENQIRNSNKMTEEGALEHFYKRDDLSEKERTTLWALCSLYMYGGIYVSQDITEMVVHPGAFVDTLSLGNYKSHSTGGKSGCRKKRPGALKPSGYAVLTPDETAIDMAFMAVSPRHPSLRHVLEDTMRANVTEIHTGSEKGPSSLVFSLEHGIMQVLSASSAQNSWTFLAEQCSPCHHDTNFSCCDIIDKRKIMKLSVPQLNDVAGKSNLTHVDDEYVLARLQRKIKESHHDTRTNAAELSSKGAVIVRETPGTPKSPERFPKVSLQDSMILEGCFPSWLCNRCLRYGDRGSFDECKSCSRCFVDLLCSAQPREEITMEVVVSTAIIQEEMDDTILTMPVLGASLSPKLIPRIIHQTWFEEITEESYPEMIRLQNSWKATGWDYRFYDDAAARAFIVDNFPSRFVDAYDAILPGAFKADFFRYLVLLIDGGIYADIDITLDTTIENFIHPNTAFLVPLDSPGSIRDERFCLWNGLMGSAPGHPFLVKAVERTINMVLNRADIFDIENEICQISGDKTETWKTRSEQQLMLTGPCALGVVVNQVLGKDPLAKFDLGFVGAGQQSELHDSAPIVGDTLILEILNVDGTLRFLDPVRNVVVATTNTKFPKREKTSTIKKQSGGMRGSLETPPKKEKPHYSTTIDSQHLWGSQFIYTDKFVTNEKITLNVVLEE